MRFQLFSVIYLTLSIVNCVHAVPLDGTENHAIEYKAIEQLSDSLDDKIYLDGLKIKRPLKLSNAKPLDHLLPTSHPLNSERQFRSSRNLITRTHKAGKSNSVKTNKKRSEQELFDEFLATDALTGEVRERKKRSAFSQELLPNPDTPQSDNSPEAPKRVQPPKFSRYFQEKLSSNVTINVAFEQGRQYLSEQKQIGASILKQYNIEFSQTANQKSSILEDAAKRQKKQKESIDHSEIENSFLMKAINFATSWKGITLLGVLTFFYLLYSALSNRRYS